MPSFYKNFPLYICWYWRSIFIVFHDFHLLLFLYNLVSNDSYGPQKHLKRRPANTISQSWYKRFIHKAVLFTFDLFLAHLKQQTLLYSRYR